MYKRQGLARAVELIKLLRRHDSRYVLHVPGKRPEEFANTWNVPEAVSYTHLPNIIRGTSYRKETVKK